MKQKIKYYLGLLFAFQLVFPILGISSEKIKYFADYPLEKLYSYEYEKKFHDELNEIQLNEIKEKKIISSYYETYYKVYYKNNKIRKAESFLIYSDKVEDTFYYNEDERLIMKISKNYMLKIDYKKDKIIDLYVSNNGKYNGNIYIVESFFKDDELYKDIYFNIHKEVEKYHIYTSRKVKIYDANDNLVKEKWKYHIK